MGNKVKNQRIFYMFNKEESGFGTAHEPSGYVKIEVRDGKGQLSAMVQNLKEDKLDYEIYMMKCVENKVFPVRLGRMPLHKNKGEIQWEFDPENVAGTGNSIDEYNVVAVLVKREGKGTMPIQCPLAAYKDKRVPWREGMKNFLYAGRDRPEPLEDTDRIPGDMDIISKFDAKIESKYQVKESSAASNIQELLAMEAPEQPAEPASGESGGREEAEADSGVEPDAVRQEEDYGPEEVYPQLQDSRTDGGAEDLNPEKGSPEESREDGMEVHEEDRPEESVKPPLSPLVSDERVEMKQVEEKQAEEKQAEDYSDLFGRSPAENGGSGPAAPKTQPATGYKDGIANCTYKNDGFCVPQYDSSGYSPCTYCQMNAGREDGKNSGVKNSGTGNNRLEVLIKNLDNYFEKCDPFNSRRRDYRWWKVNSPVYLNNLLYQCNIKTPLLFNPRVMMAHFKYRHLVVGIYSDRIRRKEYIVCGIPGVYSVDDVPFGDLCRWVQIEGSRPRYGAFGYWLVYIDYETGKFINFS
ncbi:MAG: hypothetical protein QHH06_06380 [Clostridiales bacterium]|jgi:hypothetical protein|nr:hypothetical protein [Eubacteriales bacterium]MDH7566091.1 hypothetical protein [Clostridiales bacterium]